VVDDLAEDAVSLTERANSRTAAIDLATPLEIVDLMTAEDAEVVPAVAAERAHIARAIEIAELTLQGGGRLYYIGAGTSGRLGVLDASECPPTFSTPPHMVVGIIAGGTAALTRAREGVEDRPEQGARDLEEHDVGAHDFVIGIAASAKTPYVLGALVYAHARGARTALIAMSTPSAELLAVVDVAITPMVGPEVIAGSTRLKAGSATKLVLNMISTGAMIRLGKTYGNRMIDLHATNAKLRARAERLVASIGGVTPDAARKLLAKAAGSAKTAIVMARLGVGVVEAEKQLRAAHGFVRRVLGGPPPST
jgi:N-acetylmuramic acid 6-phosphate etherase